LFEKPDDLNRMLPTVMETLLQRFNLFT